MACRTTEPAADRAEPARLPSPGARPADVGRRDVSRHVPQDPEANESCLLKRRVEP